MLSSLANSTVKLRQIKLSNAKQKQFLDFENDMKGAWSDASILHHTEGLHKVWNSLRH